MTTGKLRATEAEWTRAQELFRARILESRGYARDGIVVALKNRRLAILSWPGRDPIKGRRVHLRLRFEGANGFTLVYGCHPAERAQWQRLMIAKAQDIANCAWTLLRPTLRELREQRGLSQTALAERAGVTIADVVEREAGMKKSVEILRRLSMALGVSTVALGDWTLFDHPTR